MKKLFYFFLFFFCSFTYLFGNPVKLNIESGGYDREYLLYVPQSYRSEIPSDLIICLHGFNSNMNVFFDKYDIREIADNLNMIVLAPQALPEKSQDVLAKAATLKSLGIDIPLEAVWGCGLRVAANTFLLDLDIELNKEVDDVGFINTIIGKTTAEYNISQKNRFILGTSMGGFMSYQYAMYNGNGLSGLISICGSMGTSIKNTTADVHLPICDFHSITDEVVPYDGFLEYSVSVFDVKVSLCQPKNEVIQFWTGKNNATNLPKVEDMKNYPSNKPITVKKETYSHPTNEVIHYRIDGANHEYYFKKENGDCMDYNEEIARFITAHTEGSGSGINKIQTQDLSFYPNPAKDLIHFHVSSGQVSVFELNGRQVFSGILDGNTLDIQFLNKGMYIIRVVSGDEIYQGKLIIN